MRIELTGAADGVWGRAGLDELAERLAHVLVAVPAPGEVVVGRAGPATARVEVARGAILSVAARRFRDRVDASAGGPRPEGIHRRIHRTVR